MKRALLALSMHYYVLCNPQARLGALLVLLYFLIQIAITITVIINLNHYHIRLMDVLPCQVKPSIIRAPNTPIATDSKSIGQYEAVFLQLADEHRTVNAFELHELLEACLPNGK